MKQSIPVIDLFAGPGGLGEGFSSLKKNGRQIFKLALSVEKEANAHQTLTLRALFRSFENTIPDSYYDYITGKTSKQEFSNNKLIHNQLKEARNEAKNATLGETPSEDIDKWIKAGINNNSKWVLIGGPPCQAYSLAGRSKMMNSDLKKYETDARHLLYREYLRIIKKHSPPVFIMENVKGILSSKHLGELIFKKIINDLSNPKSDLEYEIRSLTVETPSEELEPRNFIIESERYGIPQARHRVILFGVRKDLAKKKHKILHKEDQFITLNDVLGSLPRIRSKLSQETDSFTEWCKALKATKTMLNGWNEPLKKELIAELDKNTQLAKEVQDTGGAFLESESNLYNDQLNHWYTDPRLNGVTQHQARSHMRSDIQRYFFLSSYAKISGKSAKIGALPNKLLPAHQNANLVDAPFQDRFRVQLADHPSTTIVSHIAKDGHYYIHPDPSQARSLSVREAARLQTFPDNYFFEGNKTSQYGQVGNAVPPLLANKIARIILEFIT